jgi:hypothetical protein
LGVEAALVRWRSIPPVKDLARRDMRFSSPPSEPAPSERHG